MAELERVHTAEHPDALHVVFIHGLGGDAKKTWMHNPEDEATLLPKWIGEDLKCHAWCLGYDAEISRWSNSAMAIPDQGNAVLNALSVKPALSTGKIILVGHSMGGLVIKAALLSTGHDSVRKRVIGVAFVATPHQGSQLGTLADALRLLLHTNPQVGELNRNNAYLRDMNQRFRHLFDQHNLNALVLAEMHSIKVEKRFLGLIAKTVSIMVVEPDSADPGLHKVLVVPCPEDHFSIAKPRNRDTVLYETMLKFIRDVSTTPSPSTPAPPTPPATPPPTLKGKSLQPNDTRLQPRESKVYGRDTEIAQVVAFLQGGDAAPSTQAITGTGGIGKTELCKAALKKWLKEEPNAVAYYVTIPDRGSVANLITNLAAAIGATQIESSEQLLAVLPPALYYLDNLESVAECADGQQFLRNLKETSGVRLLVSSRLDSSSIFRKSLSLGVLPDVAALALFRDTWAGQVLPDDAALRDFVLHDLGAHALSVTITARLGDCYAFGELVDRWRSIGTQVAADVGDESRLGNLNTSLRLTAQVLGQTAGSLELWMLSALFPSGVPHEILQQFEKIGGWGITARQMLVRHHVLVRQSDIFSVVYRSSSGAIVRSSRFGGEYWLMLPPLARYALAASQNEEDGFAWTRCSPLARALLDTPATPYHSFILVNSHFETIATIIRHEALAKKPDIRWIENVINNINYNSIANKFEAYSFLLFLDKINITSSVKKYLGELAYSLGKKEIARDFYTQSLRFYKEENNILEQANISMKLGGIENILEEVDIAFECYKQALLLFESIDNQQGKVNALAGLGNSLKLNKKWQDAIEYFNAAIIVIKTSGKSPFMLSSIYAELARCHHALRHYDLRDQMLRDAKVCALNSEGVGRLSLLVIGSVEAEIKL